MAQRLDGHLLERRIRVAMGAVEADLVLKQATVPNLFTNKMITADVAIADGYVAGLGEYAGRQEIDCRGRYLCPAFIDGHVHIESTMTLPGEFASSNPARHPDRHCRSPRDCQCLGLGIVRGFGIENAAIASTVAHDSHNLIVVGDNDRDMLAAIEAVQQSGGGVYLVSGGQARGGLPLPVAGLMSDLAALEITSGIADLTAMACRCGVNERIEPLGMLSFLSLPVIPEGRITPDGLYDVLESRFIPVSV